MDKKTLIETGFFIDNEYLDKMFEIIHNPDLSGKTERHHILPKSIGGTDEEDNLINISVKQHFYVHYYLTFCTVGKLKMKMNFAFKMMAFTRDEWKSINQKVIDDIADYYAKMVEAGCFKNNYERTDEVKQKIANTLKERAKNTKLIWINDGESEKYIPEEEAKKLLNDGWARGRKHFSKEAIENMRQATLKIKAAQKEKDKEDGYICLKNLHGTRYNRLTLEDKMKAFYSNVEKAFKNHKCLVSEDGINFEMMSYFDIKNSNKNLFPKLYYEMSKTK